MQPRCVAPFKGDRGSTVPDRTANALEASALTRATKEEKGARLAHVRDFQQRYEAWPVAGGQWPATTQLGAGGGPAMGPRPPATSLPPSQRPSPDDSNLLSSRARAVGEGVAISSLPERLPGQTAGDAAPWQHPSSEALVRLQQTARSGGNVFAELLQAVCSCSLGQITHALYEVGGQYRRSM